MALPTGRQVSDPQQLLEFPFNYLGDFTDSYNVVDGSSGDVTWTYSGYGTLITSNGTFNNVVKTHNDYYDRVVFWNRRRSIPSWTSISKGTAR